MSVRCPLIQGFCVQSSRKIYWFFWGFFTVIVNFSYYPILFLVNVCCTCYNTLSNSYNIILLTTRFIETLERCIPLRLTFWWLHSLLICILLWYSCLLFTNTNRIFLYSLPSSADILKKKQPIRIWNNWVKRDQLDGTCFVITLFSAQHVSDVNTSILRSLQLIRRVTSWVVSGSMCVGVLLQCGYGGVVSVCRLQPAYGYHTTTAKPQRNTNTHRTRTIQPMK